MKFPNSLPPSDIESQRNLIDQSSGSSNLLTKIIPNSIYDHLYGNITNSNLNLDDLDNNKDNSKSVKLPISNRLYKFINGNYLFVMISILLSVVLVGLYLRVLEMEDQLKQVFINGHYSIESLTKDVSVKPIHSHNDEWRQHPLFDALKIGSNSIEADVHYKSKNPNLIYVGHNSASLSDKKNLESMYLNPLYQLLEEANPISSDNDNNIIEKKNGIFYNSPENTTYFYLDIKNDRENLIKTLDNKLQRFSDKGFLTIFNTTSNEFIQGPLTIIITGDYPYEYINSMKIRTMFIDAPLKSISQDSNEASKYPSQKISIFASDPLNKLVGSHQTISLFNGLSKKQVNTISGIVDNAHSLGLKTRIWDTPKFTYSSKVKIWKQLLSIGSDYLNVDSLQQAVKF